MCYTSGVCAHWRHWYEKKASLRPGAAAYGGCTADFGKRRGWDKARSRPWDDPNNLIKDGAVYTAYNEDGYIVAWETPECDVNGKYMLIKNDTELKVEYRVSYMGDVPWGHVTVKNDGDEDFAGWVLMSDLLGADGKPAAEAPVKIPDHPMIADPTPEPSEEPENPEATPTPTVPVRPEQAINISNTYNSAIVYTSVAIAAVAIAFAIPRPCKCIKR